MMRKASHTAPFQVMWTILLAFRSYYIAPVVCEPRHTRLAEFQLFAWSEAEMPDVMQQRAHAEEPMFCYHTALRMAFWSVLAYRETKVLHLFFLPFVSVC